MSDFNSAINPLLQREGGFVDNPHDKGGATNYGISLRFLKSLQPDATVNDIKNLTPYKAKAIYRTYFWDTYRLGEIANQAIAEKAFDMFVNLHPKTAALLLQKSLNALQPATVSEDGIIGDKTLQAINHANSSLLLMAIRLNCVRQYVAIADADPSQRVFFFGWIKNRALL